MKRKLYFWVRKHVTSENIRIAILAIPLVIILVQQILAGSFDWSEIFDVSILITFILLAISDALVEIIKQMVSKKAEDSAKLTDAYGSLVKKYACSNLFKYHGVSYPEECLWVRGGNESISVKDLPKKYYHLPKEIADYSKEIMEAHSASVVYNNINIRLDKIETNDASGQVVLTTSRTHYFDSLLTNRACDYVFSDRKVTIRELYEPGPFIKPLSMSKMSNHLGFNGFVLTSDTKKIPFILRKNNLSIAKNLWGTSISASMKSRYALEHWNNFHLTEHSFGKAIIGELKDELQITEDRALDLENVKNSIFALYRDLVECGKPQFLFCLQLIDTTEDVLREFFTKNKCKSNKNDTSKDGNVVCFFSLEQLRNAKYYIDKIVVDGITYKMTPSHIVSVILLLEYMK